MNFNSFQASPFPPSCLFFCSFSNQESVLLEGTASSWEWTALKEKQ